MQLGQNAHLGPSRGRAMGTFISGEVLAQLKHSLGNSRVFEKFKKHKGSKHSSGTVGVQSGHDWRDGVKLGRS